MSDEDLVKRFADALDCCGTCAGGVLARHVREAQAQAWMDGAFYYGGDAAEQWYFNDGGSDHNPHTPPNQPTDAPDASEA